MFKMLDVQICKSLDFWDSTVHKITNLPLIMQSDKELVVCGSDCIVVYKEDGT